MTLSSADREAIFLLKEIQQSSHDPDRPVSVVIVNSHDRIIATGTNQPPDNYGFNLEDTHKAISEDPRWKYYMLEHAERNAILHALKEGVSLKGCTMYGSLFPCADCARAIVAAGIKRVVIPEPGLHPERDEKWREHYHYAREIFLLSDVIIDHYSIEDAQ